MTLEEMTEVPQHEMTGMNWDSGIFSIVIQGLLSHFIHQTQTALQGKMPVHDTHVYLCLYCTWINLISELNPAASIDHGSRWTQSPLPQLSIFSLCGNPDNSSRTSKKSLRRHGDTVRKCLGNFWLRTDCQMSPNGICKSTIREIQKRGRNAREICVLNDVCKIIILSLWCE